MLASIAAVGVAWTVMRLEQVVHGRESRQKKTSLLVRHWETCWGEFRRHAQEVKSAKTLSKKLVLTFALTTPTT